jgi:hypothetical protein
VVEHLLSKCEALSSNPTTTIKKKERKKKKTICYLPNIVVDSGKIKNPCPRRIYTEKLEYFPWIRRGSHYVVQAGFHLWILLSQPPECWNYRYVLLYPAPQYFCHHYPLLPNLIPPILFSLFLSTLTLGPHQVVLLPGSPQRVYAI